MDNETETPLPRPTPAEASRNIAVQLATISTMLIEKGVCTQVEFDALKAQCETIIDQRLAARRDEFLKTEEGKGAAFLAKLMGAEL